MNSYIIQTQNNLFTLTLIKEKEERNIIWKFAMNLANYNLENSYRAIQGSRQNGSNCTSICDLYENKMYKREQAF